MSTEWYGKHSASDLFKEGDRVSTIYHSPVTNKDIMVTGTLSAVHLSYVMINLDEPWRHEVSGWITADYETLKLISQ